jgi:Ca2+/Na+ antiporter
MKVIKSPVFELFTYVAGALVLRFVLEQFIDEKYGFWVRIISVVVILLFGALFVLKGTAKIIEETTGALSKKTKLAGGMLQSLGTAFPDMILGVVAAVISLRLVSTDYPAAINYAIIAAATTFGSNIYNIGHAVWCVYRQNLANQKGKPILMFPFAKKLGTVTPLKDHKAKPALGEFDNSIDILNVLTLLTAAVAISMVLFGRLSNPPAGMTGDLYQLVKPVGVVILVLCIFAIYYFRKSKKEESRLAEEEEENYYHKKSITTIFVHLLFSGVAILFAAETMVNAVKVFSDLTGLPFVMTGVLAGIIGCLGEMIVIHNFTVNPKGRIGDAIVGVSMDNIVTTMGAAIVAIMGGIFLGGNALILIFVIILALNTMLIWQISRLKNYFYKNS